MELWELYSRVGHKDPTYKWAYLWSVRQSGFRRNRVIVVETADSVFVLEWVYVMKVGSVLESGFCNGKFVSYCSIRWPLCARDVHKDVKSQ